VTEALTRIADTHAPDDVYEHVRQHFTDSTGVFQAVAFETRNNAISAIYLVRNPDKLAHLRTQLGLG
jgi:hypothetical protein